MNRREILAGIACAFGTMTARRWRPDRLFAVCSEDNDLFRTIAPMARRFDRSDDAVCCAQDGASVLILADRYPAAATPFDSHLFESARGKKLRLYIEYPSWLPESACGEPIKARFERAVVASRRFLPSLHPMRILSVNDCYYIPLSSRHPEIVLARVAGCETAAYGIPADASPMLFLQSSDLMVAATKLSRFRTARYGPWKAWVAVWEGILRWLSEKDQEINAPLRANATVAPYFTAQAPLSPGAERKTFLRGIAWYGNARMLVDRSWRPAVERALERKSHLAPAPPQPWPAGDGSCGLLEGVSSSINLDGSQPVRWTLRADCTGETSFAFAMASAIQNPSKYRLVAENLNQFLYRSQDLAGRSRDDPASPCFGLLNWDSTAKGIYYGDDNARAILGTIGAAGILETEVFDKRVLSCILGNFRTTGPLGFRGKRLDEVELNSNGWRHYFDWSRTHYSPHFEAFPWAVYLWAYDKTGYRPFLDRTKSGIEATMRAYPKRWRWTNGIQQERARMLLPLAWLVRVEDTTLHRGWLRFMTRELLRFQAPSGAIYEELGTPGMGAYGPPASNRQYGIAEAPLIQRNGDPICDLLYTANFAFLGLHEAAAATGERPYREATAKLAELFCRIQIRSAVHPELHGGWFRAFDDRLWDYWASNSDSGWGAWAIETGWTQAWIVSVLGMRQIDTSLWEITRLSKLGRWTDELKPLFLPGSP